jgi:hypothetical protein
MLSPVLRDLYTTMGHWILAVDCAGGLDADAKRAAASEPLRMHRR